MSCGYSQPFYNERVLLMLRIRKALVKSNPHCHYCQRKLSLRQSTVDHVLATSKGGKDEKENCVLACISCNHAKADMDYQEFKDLKKLARLETVS